MFEKENVIIFLRVQQGCNLNCDHCFTLGNKDKVRTTPFEYVEQFVDAIARNVNPSDGVIYLHGGETFLAKMDYLKKVTALIKERFSPDMFKIIPQTNLIYKVDDEFIDFIKNHCSGHIGVSWDAEIRFGSIRIQNKERQEKLFFTNLKKLIDAGISVHISITAQKHLLAYTPQQLNAMFDGVTSIDFEHLTVFDEKTQGLRVNLARWSDWLDALAEFYQFNEVSWSMPQVDLFTASIESGRIYNCKCNCCDRKTFTLNPNGTVGFCPDNSYISPVSNVSEMVNDWPGFESKAHVAHIERLCSLSTENCFKCEHFNECGGNCEDYFFDDTGECPLSKKVISRIKENKEHFVHLLNTRSVGKLA